MSCHWGTRFFVLFFCVDGLPGFKEAIGAVFPQAQIQRCVIHMLRNSFKYVNYMLRISLYPSVVTPSTT